MNLAVSTTEGHVDAVDDKGNRPKLDGDRANEVKAYLDKQIDELALEITRRPIARSFKVIGAGSSRPKYCHPDYRYRNRRVEIRRHFVAVQWPPIER